MRRFLAGFLILLLLLSLSSYAQETGGQLEGGRDILGKILAFIDTIAHYLGKGIISLIENIAGVILPESLIVPVGYLAVMTIGLALFGLMEAARKIIWLIVLLGWGLIILRVVMEILGKSNP